MLGENGGQPCGGTAVEDCCSLCWSNCEILYIFLHFILHLFKKKKQTNQKILGLLEFGFQGDPGFSVPIARILPISTNTQNSCRVGQQKHDMFRVCVCVNDVLTKRGPLGSFHGIQTSVVPHHQGQNSRINSRKPHKSFSSHPRVVISILTTTIKVAQFVLIMAAVPGRSLQTVLERTDVS